MKHMKILATFMMATLASACGQVVEVPPAYEGKILTPQGYLPEAYPPSTFRLDSCWMVGAICDKLVLIERSDKGVKEQFTVFMPRNQLEMSFDLRMTASIRDGRTDAILNRVTADDGESGILGDSHVRTIPFDRVYATYAQPIIRDATRSIVAEYTIDEIASSRDAVNERIRERLSEVLKNTPITLKTVGLAHVAYPEVITRRKEEAEQRRIEIEQEESRKQVRLIQIQTELEAAKAERAIRREKAEAAAEENRIAASSITEAYLQYKRLEVLEALAASGSTTFVPFEALDDVGVSQRVFNR